MVFDPWTARGERIPPQKPRPPDGVLVNAISELLSLLGDEIKNLAVLWRGLWQLEDHDRYPFSYRRVFKI